MNGQEYLNRISTKKRIETKKGQNGIFSSKFFWIGLIGVIGLILIMILGAILGSAGDKEKTKAFQFLAHLENTISVVQEYQPSIKSSDLRSSSASLYGVLTNINTDAMNYVTEKYNIKATKDIDKNVAEQAKTERDALNDELYKAKINGTLDRIFAYKMASEISTFMSQENELHNITKDETLKETLSQSYNSLKNLYDKFNNFSEAR